MERVRSASTAMTVLCGGFLLRDLWLLRHPGGWTPRWMLVGETAAFAAATVGAVGRAAADRPPSSITTTALGLATALHALRVVIYVASRSGHDSANSLRR